MPGARTMPLSVTASNLVNDGLAPAVRSSARLASHEERQVIRHPISVIGDYNQNGIVEAADYVLGRKQGGTATQYTTWNSHFGQIGGSGSGASANAAVPEPATVVLLMFAVARWCLRRSRAA